MRTATAFDRTVLFTLGPYANAVERPNSDVFINSFKTSLTSRVHLRLEALYEYALPVTDLADRSADDSFVTRDVILGRPASRAIAEFPLVTQLGNLRLLPFRQPVERTAD